MSIRIGAFNVENLFDRPKIMAHTPMTAGNVVLDAHATLGRLLQEPVYDDAVKTGILEQLEVLDLLADDTAEYAILRQNRGRLLKRSKTTGVTVVAEERASWIGWVELTRERTDELAMTHAAQVIRDVNADIMGVIEAENRIALKRFSDAGVVTAAKKPRYPHVMVIDGNDDRGIDVGILTKKAFPVTKIVSHVDDLDGTFRVFGRDCPEYSVHLPSGSSLTVLVRPQRHTVEHPAFVTDGHAGTYGNGSASQKIDYVRLSPALFGKVVGGAVFRMGVWGGVHGTLFPHYPTMTAAVHAASDHAAIYADLDLD